MIDFSDIENELRALRPVRPSQDLLQSISRELDESPEATETARNIIRPNRFRHGWLSLGLGIATAAVVFIMVRFDLPKVLRNAPAIVNMTPSPAPNRLASAQFIPAGATRVVFNTRDEGLHFPRGATEPVRRVRSRGRETLQWENPGTGASLRVSYPSEEVQFIPVAGQ